ncbi:MAG: helix-turn-helix domain-containing protein [Candidatus Tectomicrobia bacterium]|uniref:Helix-turn-helix domain-containing protein n=1 Tax=Tectimicrobiota bacterium TaxID=2528274 RepID=A0A933GMR7_UNCTE|nr:helix-turn-helix domain-containing protein [Candidatus Tectomicrobia bacterium]
MANKKDDIINVREAAQECGRNMETIRRWIWAGKLPAQKLGNQLFIKRSDLISYCRLPAQSLPVKAGETAVREYSAEPRADFLERAVRFQNKLRAKGVKPIDAPEEIRKMREERMEQIERSLTETSDAFRRREALLDFFEKAKAIRNEIHARTGEVFDAEAMIRELRDEREHELE